MVISELLQNGTAELEACGVENAEIDALLLLSHCLKKSRSQLFLAAAESVDEADDITYRGLIKRRSLREPVAYILGEREFWSLPFYVDRNVLIPRPETEFLLEKTLQIVGQDNLDTTAAPVIDLCCGSGVIAIILALEMKAEVIAIDYSEKALSVTQQNCFTHGVSSRVTTLHSDLFSDLQPCNTYPLIVSNPPYVTTTEIESMLEPEVAEFEPHLALDGGDDGLNIIHRIAADILTYLAPSGMFFMEIGAGQGEATKEMFSLIRSGKRVFETIEIFQDYSGKDRVLYAKANNYSE